MQRNNKGIRDDSDFSISTESIFLKFFIEKKETVNGDK